MATQLSEHEIEVQETHANLRQRAEQANEDAHKETAERDKATMENFNASLAKEKAKAKPPIRSAITPKHELSEQEQLDQEDMEHFNRTKAELAGEEPPPKEEATDTAAKAEKPTKEEKREPQTPAQILGLDDPEPSAVEQAEKVLEEQTGEDGKKKPTSAEQLREAGQKIAAEYRAKLAELSQAKEAIARSDAAAKANTTAEQETEKQTADAAFAEASKIVESHEAFQLLDNDKYPEWNAAVEKRKADALQLFNGELSWQDAAVAAHNAAAASFYRDMFLQVRDKLKSSQEYNRRLRAAEPTSSDAGSLDGRRSAQTNLSPDEQAKVDFNRALADLSGG